MKLRQQSLRYIFIITTSLKSPCRVFYKIPSMVQTLLLILLHGLGKGFINYKCSRRIFFRKIYVLT